MSGARAREARAQFEVDRHPDLSELLVQPPGSLLPRERPDLLLRTVECEDEPGLEAERVELGPALSAPSPHRSGRNTDALRPAARCDKPSCTPIPPANTEWYAAVKAPCTPYDPTDARRLVARSGVSNPTVDLLTPSDPAELRLAQFIQAEETAAGINVSIDTGSGSISAGAFDASFNAFEPGSDGEPNYIITQQFATWGTRNYSGYSNPRLDYVLRNGLKAIQPVDRAVNYRVAQQILLADRPAIFLYDSVYLAAYSTSLKGVRLLPNGLLDVEYAQYR